MASTTFIVHWFCERLTESARFIIYALMDPRTGEYRYIGQSSTGLVRPKKHRALAKRGYSGYPYNWIRSLQNNDLAYEIVILENCNEYEKLNEREVWWIALYRSFGRLTNVSDGGEGDPRAAGLLGGRASWHKLSPKEYAARCSAMSERQKEAWAKLTEEEQKIRKSRGATQFKKQTYEERAARGRAVMLALSPQERTDRAKQAGQIFWQNMSAEERSAFVRSQRTAEKRSADSRATLMKLSPEERAERARHAGKSFWVKLTPEERTARAFKHRSAEKMAIDGKVAGAARMASLSCIERSALGRLAAQKKKEQFTPEQLSEIARKREAEHMHLREKRTRGVKNFWATLTPEERSQRARKRDAAMTPEQRIARSKAAGLARRMKRIPRLRINLLPQEASS